MVRIINEAERILYEQYRWELMLLARWGFDSVISLERVLLLGRAINFSFGDVLRHLTECRIRMMQDGTTQ